MSFKTDDDFDDMLYSVSKKKGLTKSAFIKQELGKIFESEKDQEYNNINSDINVNIQQEEKKSKFGGGINEQQIQSNEQKKDDTIKQQESSEQSKPYTELVPNITHVEPAKIEPNKRQEKIENRIDLLIDEKISEKQNQLNQQSVKQENKTIEIKEQSSTQPRIIHINKKKVNRVNDQEININPEYVAERKFRELKEKDDFNKSFEDVHRRIKNIDDRVCKDGECTKNELENIKKEIGKLDIASIKKNSDTTSDELSKLRKDLTDLKKELPKTEVCPDCGESSILHLSSFCSNCGKKITEWSDDSGNKIAGWKPYWLRNSERK